MSSPLLPLTQSNTAVNHGPYLRVSLGPRPSPLSQVFPVAPTREPWPRPRLSAGAVNRVKEDQRSPSGQSVARGRTRGAPSTFCPGRSVTSHGQRSGIGHRPASVCTGAISPARSSALANRLHRTARNAGLGAASPPSPSASPPTGKVSCIDPSGPHRHAHHRTDRVLRRPSCRKRPYSRSHLPPKLQNHQGANLAVVSEAR